MLLLQARPSNESVSYLEWWKTEHIFVRLVLWIRKHEPFSIKILLDSTIVMLLFICQPVREAQTVHIQYGHYVHSALEILISNSNRNNWRVTDYNVHSQLCFNGKVFLRCTHTYTHTHTHTWRRLSGWNIVDCVHCNLYTTTNHDLEICCEHHAAGIRTCLGFSNWFH